jgi:hypothetical protein
VDHGRHPPWNSQHPFWGVSHGEELIARVYNDLIENPRVFEKTLLLIVYDEHGGFYDHVVPPGHAGWNAGNPGLEHEVVAPTRDHVPEFDFTRLGPRVPAVAISPWIEPGSVFGWNAENPEDRHTFDHTSVLATVGEMTGVHVDSARARRATPLSVTLNRMTARTDASRLAFRRSAYHGATAASRRRPRPSAAWGGSSATASASSTVATRRRRRSPTTTRTWSVPDVPVRTLATDHRARASDRAREAGPVGMRLGEVRGLASDRQGGARAPSGTTA